MSSMQLYSAGNKEDPENHLLRVYHAHFLKQRVRLAVFNSFPSVENQVTHLIFFFCELLQLLEDC